MTIIIIILDNYPPSTLQGVGLGGRKNPRIIVGENCCHFGASYRKTSERGYSFKDPSKTLLLVNHAFARATPAIFVIFVVFTVFEQQSPCLIG